MLGKPARLRSESQAKGADLEIRFLHLLHKNGFDARLSDSNRTWDIEVYLPSSIQRIQVKAGYWDKDKWVIGLTNGGKGNKRAYEKSDFDFLAFNGPEQQLYLVPSIDLHLSRKGGKSLPTASSGMHIRYSDYLIYAPN